MNNSIYQNLVLEIGRVFIGAPPWVEEYLLPILTILSIIFLFSWVISLVFAFVKNLIKGGK